MGKVSQQADTLLSFVLGPMERVRQFCLDCQGGQESFVTGCEDSGCAFFAQRLSVRENTITHMAAGNEQRQCLRAIRRFCLCCAGGKGRSPLLWRRVPLRSVGVPLRRHAEDIRTR